MAGIREKGDRKEVREGERRGGKEERVRGRELEKD